MTDPIDLAAERDKREQPNAEHVMTDDFGRPMFKYLFNYHYQGGSWGLELWAYSMEDAEQRDNAIACSIEFAGQIYATVPA